MAMAAVSLPPANDCWRRRSLRRLPPAPSVNFAQKEIAERPFVGDAARPALGQAIVGQGFEPQRRDRAAGRLASVKSIDVALGLIAAGQDRTVGENRQRRHIALGRQSA